MESSLPTGTIRRCVYRELDRVTSIYNHYISNTVMSLDLDTKPIIYMQKLFNSVHDQNLPFLVVTASNDDDPARGKEEILGYAYVRNLGVPLPCLGPNFES